MFEELEAEGVQFDDDLYHEDTENTYTHVVEDLRGRKDNYLK